MSKRIKLLIFAMLFVMTTSVSYAYMVTKVKTNEAIIKIGNNAMTGATITFVDGQNNFLIPYNSTLTDSREVKEVVFILRVETPDSRGYTITHDLPVEFELIGYNPTKVYTTNQNYTLTIRLLSEVSYNQQTFYLWINL